MNFWDIARRALYPSVRDKSMEKIKSVSLEAFNYINNIDYAFLCDYAENEKIFHGMHNSNLIEQLNAEFLDERSRDLFNLVLGIISKSNAKIQDELKEMQLCKSVICPEAIRKYQENSDFSLGKEWVVRKECFRTERYNVFEKENLFGQQHYETVCISEGYLFKFNIYITF